MNVLELTRELIRFDTINPPGSEGICARQVGRLLEDGGFTVTYHELPDERPSLVARIGGATARPPLCFTGHLDTVPLGARPWTTFVRITLPKIRWGLLYGVILCNSRVMGEFGAFRFNLGARSLTKNGEDVALTTGEFALLKVLVMHPRAPLSRDKLMELARGREFGAFDRSIDVQVSRLRKLIEDDPSKPAFIQTVWGFGYVFIPDGKASES